MRFFKEHSYDIIRLYVNQIGITIFSMMLYTAIGGVTEDIVLFARLRTAISVFSILFYFVLIYYVMWEIGAKDKIRIDGGRIFPFRTKGVILELFANIPNLILSVLSVLFVSIYLISQNAVANSAFAVLIMITMYHASMYMGLIQTCVYGMNVPDVEVVDYPKYLIVSILFVAVPLLSVVVSHVAYTLGSKEIKLLSLFKAKKK